MARQGANVLINYNQNRDAAEAVQREVETLGRKAVIIQADISNLDAHEKMLETAHDAFGKVNILINNAGITRIADILEETPEQFDLLLNTNLKAPHFLTQRVANYMIEMRSQDALSTPSPSQIQWHPTTEPPTVFQKQD